MEDLAERSRGLQNSKRLSASKRYKLTVLIGAPGSFTELLVKKDAAQPRKHLWTCQASDRSGWS